MIQLDVSIMGHAYKLACREGEEGALCEAVAYLDDKMCALRDARQIKGQDRIAGKAALGIAAELLASKGEGGPFGEMTLAEIKQKITAMHSVIDAALAPQENLF